MENNIIKIIHSELIEATNVLAEFRQKGENLADIALACKAMLESLKAGGKLISIGNGGSYSDAQHFASELSGKYRGVRPAIAAMALSDGGAMSCIANDFGYNHVFKRQLEAIGKPGDTLLCLSTSGTSENILVAAEYAKRVGINVIGISGNSGGKLKQYCDVMIEIPHSGSADRVQELSIVIIHILVNLIEKGSVQGS
jgi:D-sedoheptulose 7-phosphate isomerase